MNVVNGMALLQVDVVIFVVGVRAVFVKKRRDTLINAPEKKIQYCAFSERARKLSHHFGAILERRIVIGMICCQFVLNTFLS